MDIFSVRFTPLLGYPAETYSAIGCYDGLKVHSIRHEFAHGLLGGNNFHVGGGFGPNYWIPQGGCWSMLGLANSSLLTWNAWDRQRLDWRLQGNQYNPSVRSSDGSIEVNGDLDASIPTQSGIYILRDFVTTGDALRIRLPFIDSNKEFEQFIWIENHQGKANNGSMFDKYIYEGEPCVQSLVPGIMAYLQIGAEKRSYYMQEYTGPTDSVFGYLHVFEDYLRNIPANGFFDREFEQTEIIAECIYGKLSRPHIKKHQNPLTGGGDQEAYAVILTQNDTLKKHDQLGNHIEKRDGIYYHEYSQGGHTSHVFTVNGKNKISIGSNPSSASMMNQVSGNGEPVLLGVTKNLRKIYLNGVSIKLLEQLNSGAIKVQIRFDDIDVNQDVRWCADSIILNYIITPSGYSLNLKNGKTITLDQGFTATRITDPIIYDGNKVFASPTFFRVKDDAVVNMEENSRFIVQNGSTLKLESGSKMLVNNACSLVVKSGSTLIVEDCASLIIKETGKLVVESGGILKIMPGAMVSFGNGYSSFNLSSAAVIPPGYKDPHDISLPFGIFMSNITQQNKECFIAGNILVGGNVTLTLNNMNLKFMDSNSKIIVNPGAKLILDNTTLSNGCENNAWYGVVVLGNSSFDQNETYQGKLVVRNNSVIENSLKGITTGYAESWVFMTGAIIEATNSTFRNNKTDVMFHPYQNILNTGSNTYVLNNISFFSNCTFETDANTLHATHNEHVRMTSVDGISFRGCQFIDRRTNLGLVRERTGIYSQTASFRVNEYCSAAQPIPAPPSCNGTRTSFVNLSYAIRAYGLYTPSKSITVKNTDFTNNYRGIYLSGIDNTEILLNNFTIPIGNSSDNHSYGVYLDGGTNYHVEGNDFQGNIIGSKGISYGVVTKNTGSDHNQIYRNTFANLTIGIEAIGNNKGDRVDKGLEIKCNDFANGRYDVFVTPEITDGNTLPVGIRELQGSTSSSSVSAPAGNLFGNSSPILVSNYKNQGEYITYISHSPASNSRVVPFIYDVNTIGIVVSPINFTDYSCPDGTVTPGPRSEISEERSEAASEAAAIEAELAALVDNGNTELLEQEVLNTNTNNAYSSYNSLLEVSPYISEEVLQTIGAKEEGLSNAMIRDIMVANPQAAKSEEVLGTLDNRENQLSWYMRSQIEAGRTVLGGKELLEIARAIKATAYRDATGRGIRSIVHYEEDADLNELRAWLENLPEFEYRLLYAETWFAENDFQSGLQALLGIAENMELTEIQQGIVNDYVLFYQNLESWIQNNPALTGLDENAIALLQTLAVKDNSIGAKARNLLVINNVSDYEEPLYLPLEERNSAVSTPVIAILPEVENNVSFRVYPNPAREYFTIEWCGLGEENTPNSKVLVSGMDGRGISEVKVNEACNQKIIDTRSWASGNYTLSLLVDGIIVKTLKLNISK